MNSNITKEALLGIGITTIASGVGLVQVGKITEGVIVTVIGFAIIAVRGILKKYNC